jgi:4-amino-4-deoxy-L-arabinose transferase-like glycosyltransferase
VSAAIERMARLRLCVQETGKAGMAKDYLFEKQRRFATITRVGEFFSGLNVRNPRRLWWSAVGLSELANRLALTAIIAAGGFLRMWQINSLGFNSDEAVYAGQGAAIAADPTLREIFPIFRAHPLLFQFVLALGFRFAGVSDLLGRMLSVVVGLATIYLICQLGALLYGRKAGLLAAPFVALMPYHVIVTRQVLLDGPMALFATLTLYMLARFATTRHPAWLYAAGAGMGLTFLTKETGLVLIGAIYVFLSLCPTIRVRIRDLVGRCSAWSP